ncbi:MAG: aldo/keto reductase, partial [Pseudomonas sp.]
DRSLKALRSEYVDLFMLHWPTTDWDLPRTLDTLVSFKEQGLARNIGVANFPLPLLRKVIEELGTPLSAIQVEYHVLLGQNALLDYARQHDMALTAYTPLARNKVSQSPAIQQIAAKHGVLPTQVALKWLLDQPNVAAIPKASSESNQLANLAALDVQLDDEDRALIASLSKRERQVSPDFAPVWDAFDE